MNTNTRRYYVVKVTFQTTTTPIEQIVTILADSPSSALEAAAVHSYGDTHIESIKLIETDAVLIIQGN